MTENKLPSFSSHLKRRFTDIEIEQYLRKYKTTYPSGIPDLQNLFKQYSEETEGEPKPCCGNPQYDPFEIEYSDRNFNQICKQFSYEHARKMWPRRYCKSCGHIRYESFEHYLHLDG